MSFFEALTRGAFGTQGEKQLAFFDFLTSKGKAGSLYRELPAQFCPDARGRELIAELMTMEMIVDAQNYLEAVAQGIVGYSRQKNHASGGSGIFQIFPDNLMDVELGFTRRPLPAAILNAHAFFIYDDCGLRFWTVTPDWDRAAELQRLYQRWRTSRRAEGLNILAN